MAPGAPGLGAQDQEVRPPVLGQAGEDRDLAPVEEVAGEAAPGQGLKVGAGDHVQKLA